MFSRLDLKDAYHQLELHSDSRELTTFLSHLGLFQFTRAIFGPASAGPCFQKVMTSMLDVIPGVEMYILTWVTFWSMDGLRPSMKPVCRLCSSVLMPTGFVSTGKECRQ